MLDLEGRVPPNLLRVVDARYRPLDGACPSMTYGDTKLWAVRATNKLSTQQKTRYQEKTEPTHLHGTRLGTAGTSTLP